MCKVCLLLLTHPSRLSTFHCSHFLGENVLLLARFKIWKREAAVSATIDRAGIKIRLIKLFGK